MASDTSLSVSAMISFKTFFKQRMVRFFVIVFAIFLLLANIAVYFTSSVQYTRQIERQETSFVEILAHLYTLENPEMVLTYVEHYDHTNGVNLAYYSLDGTLLYQSEIAPVRQERTVLTDIDGNPVGEIVLDYQTSFFGQELTFGLVVINLFSLTLFGIGILVFYRFLNKQYALLDQDLAQIGQEGVPFRFLDMDTINRRYTDALKIEKELKSIQEHYVRVLAHDIKTPLTVLKAYLEGVQSGRIMFDSAVNQDLLAEIEVIERLVPQFIATTTDQIPRVQNIACLLKTQLERLRQVFVTKNISIDARIDDLELNIAASDILRISEHLLFNAFYYSSNGARIHFTLDQNSRSLIVQDHGIGMSAATLEHIKQGPYREETAQKYHQKGSGIGLQIVLEIIKRIKATINITSQPKNGTTVTIVFPNL